MDKIIIFVVLISITFSQNTNNSGRSYFFKMGKNTNEFKVNNRIMYLNHNITDLEYPLTDRRRIYESYHPVEKTPIKQTLQPQFDFSFYLDKEWNYNHKDNTINKSHLPMFINRFYQEKVSAPNTEITTRILFNKNVNSSSTILKFNLDSIDPEDTIIDADLYFYWSLKNTSKYFKESVVLRLYQYEKSIHDNGTISVENPDVHKLFNVIYVSKAQKGWQMFKVKKPIDNWLNGEENLGLILTISSYDTNELIEVFNDTNKGNFSTFIMIETQNNDSIFENTEKSAVPEEDTASHCQRKSWTVNFKKMGWDKFIIFPEEFVAYDCSGKCLKPTEKEIIHVKLLHIFQKRSASCVPIRYASLPIMYFDKFGDIACKNYNKVIVTACGCR